VAKKKRRADHRRDPRRPTIVRRHETDPSARAEDQPLMRSVSHALHQGHPLAVLALASGMLAATEPRGGPYAGDEDPAVSLDNLVESFEETDLASTTALLHLLAALSPDELLAARLRRSAATRQHRLPAWLTRLSEVSVERVFEMRHVLRDGENYLIDVRLPDGFRMTAVVYVDNNLGQVVKDAFVMDQPLEEVLEFYRAHAEEDTTIGPVDAAEARARIEAALEIEAIMFPPMESDTWPACRPLVRWLVAQLPAGASVPEYEPPDEKELDAIVEDFLASAYGQGFDDEDHRFLLGVIVDFGSMYDVGDPLRWSPVNIELLLVDRVPRKVVEDARVLTKLPNLLRSFVRYAYHERGLRPALLQEALEAVGRWEPEYQRLIRTPRAQGAEALALMAQGLETGLELRDPYQYLVDVVGGEDELALLDDDPLPDEPFDSYGLDDDIRPKVDEIAALCDASADSLLDVEHRTANRRLLYDLARVNPAFFRGRAAANTSAAAICYMVAHANGSLNSFGPLTASKLLAAFGVSSAAQRTHQFRDFLGLPAYPELGEPMSLRDRDYLVSSRRAALMEQRDQVEVGD
jgi:hypothetical protein